MCINHMFCEYSPELLSAIFDANNSAASLCIARFNYKNNLQDFYHFLALLSAPLSFWPINHTNFAHSLHLDFHSLRLLHDFRYLAPGIKL